MRWVSRGRDSGRKWTAGPMRFTVVNRSWASCRGCRSRGRRNPERSAGHASMIRFQYRRRPSRRATSPVEEGATLNRRAFFRRLEGAFLCAGVPLAPPHAHSSAEAEPVRRSAGETPFLEIGFGPQLFLDDYLIERLEGLEWRVQPPERLERPVLD